MCKGAGMALGSGGLWPTAESVLGLKALGIPSVHLHIAEQNAWGCSEDSWPGLRPWGDMNRVSPTSHTGGGSLR